MSKEKTQKNNLIMEFKEYITKRNLLDLAVGVIIGSAFSKIITSLVNDLLMPFIGMISGGVNFSNLVLKLGDASINYGLFLQNIVDFLIIAFSMFLVIKFMNKIEKKEEAKVEKVIDEKTELLKEIRDLIKKNKKVSKKK